SVSSKRIEAARSARKRMKLIARGWRDGRSVKASVSLEALALEHPLASVDGTSSSLVVRTDMLRELQIIERQPTLRQTAYALFSDLLAIHEGRLSPCDILISYRPDGPPNARRPRRDVRPPARGA